MAVDVRSEISRLIVSSRHSFSHDFKEVEIEEEKKPSSGPFWQFQRSSSLNYDNRRNNTLIRSLHFLSLSNCTSSAPNPKPSMIPKVMQKQHS
ncbi:uncharacterized protein [Coffea arabica]|uniref:Uncharacterized protein n=1 Tax=Coffea arabica TaxID=13443 RepID=A0A6P6V8P3_COFAR|nr:uncharacterized protein LOC113718599 [Coffea arabica]